MLFEDHDAAEYSESLFADDINEDIGSRLNVEATAPELNFTRTQQGISIRSPAHDIYTGTEDSFIGSTNWVPISSTDFGQLRRLGVGV